MTDQAMAARLRAMGHRVQMMVARGVLKAVNDVLGIQGLQLSALDGELIDAERMQDYGFTSAPHPGAEAVMVFAGGLRSHALVVAVGDRRYRLKGLQAGEVAVYDDLEQQVLLGREGIRIVSSMKVDIEAPEVTVTAESKVTVVCPDIHLGGEGGQPVARHNDPVVAGKVVASTTTVRAL